jgi:hypothetical protein
LLLFVNPGASALPFGEAEALPGKGHCGVAFACGNNGLGRLFDGEASMTDDLGALGTSVSALGKGIVGRKDKHSSSTADPASSLLSSALERCWSNMLCNGRRGGEATTGLQPSTTISNNSPKIKI